MAPGVVSRKYSAEVTYSDDLPRSFFRAQSTPCGLNRSCQLNRLVGIEIRLRSYQITKFVRDRAHETELGLQSI